MQDGSHINEANSHLMRDAVGGDEHVSIWLRIYELCTHTAKVKDLPAPYQTSHGLAFLRQNTCQVQQTLPWEGHWLFSTAALQQVFAQRKYWTLSRQVSAMDALVWHFHAHVSAMWRLLWRQVEWHGAQR